MIRIACIIFLLLHCLYGHAQRMQQQDLFLKKGAVGILGGVAIPVLDFADDNLKPASGYATTGYNIKLGISYDLSPYIGLALQYQYTNTPFNSSEYLNDLRNANGTNGPFTFNSYTSNPWTLQGMMAGVYYPFRAYRTTVDFKLMGGFLTGVLPENTVNYTYKPNNVTLNVVQYASSATNLGVQAGFYVRHQLYKNLLLLGAADFTYTQIQYTNLTIEDTRTGATASLPNYTQYYHIISISAGLGIQFN